MTKTRLEAFSDAVIAIIITIMVLEMRAPHGTNWSALRPIVPIFLTYLMSYAYLGIYWNNHHHMLHAADRVTGTVLWANLHLLFWLSLIPFGTRWMGENHFEMLPTALYGLVLFMSAVAYYLLEVTLLRQCDSNHRLREAVGNDLKGKVSIAVYALAVVLAFVDPRLSLVIYVLVALAWLVPDSRIESVVRSEHREP